jgi:ATP-dependent Clp protease ATP-binding subunit ClpA/ATP-dependent Clp protease ATP-binding subunit ClpC
VNITVPIYQRVEGGQVHWTTLTLGPHTRSRSGRSALKVEQGLVGELKGAVQKLEPAQLEPLQLARGVRLERVRLDLTLQPEKGGRRKVTGRFPLVLEPRWLNREARIQLVYHPERQQEWFPLEQDEQLDARAVLYFQRVWRDLDDDDIAALQTNGKDRIKVISFSARPKSLLDALPERKQSIWDDLIPDRQRKQKKERPGVLRKLGVDLTQKAADLSLPLGMPRSPYREQLQLLLGGRLRRPVILVGPPQCGKSTLLHCWVHDQLVADGYEAHRNLDRVHHVWSVSGQRIIAGMSYLGDWEQRCMELLQDVGGAKIVLRIEDISAFGRLGRTRDSERNLAEFFRGPLQRGELVIVGECTADQLQRLEDEAPGFAALFSRVHVAETTPAETLRMTLNEVRSLELAYAVAFDPVVLRQTIELAGTLLSGAAFPGKALDLVRELARRARRGATTTAVTDATERTAIRSADLLVLMSSRTGLPEELLRLDQPLDVAALREDFARRIMGQDPAVDAARDLVLRIRAGLTDPRRPYAVYLFTGPTGTGKTELAKCIAEYLYGGASRLLRFDMGELSDPDAAARLVGDALQPHGDLTERVRQQPFCVLLLDEIEKAHPTVLNLLLQLFDDGRLTDASGAVADFTHAVVIMTSNLGARVQQPIGFAEAPDAVLREVARAVREFFPPELFNRIDRVVPFAPLSPATARRIATKELSALLARRGLAERSIFVYSSASVLDTVVTEGFDPALGARPLRRYLEQHVGALLAEQVSGAPASLMRIIHLFRHDDSLRLHVESLAEAPSTTQRLDLEELLDASARELHGRLPRALDALDEILASDALAGIAEEIGRQLQHADLAQPEHADALYHLDLMRQELQRLRGRAGYLYARQRSDRQQMLQVLAEVVFLERALQRVRDPGQHSAFIELLHIGIGRRRPGFRDQGSGLMEALAAAYLAGRGELEGWAAQLADGRVVSGAGVEGPDAALLRSRPDQLVLKRVGLGVLDFFSGEQGCHIWRSLGAGSDVLRVRVWSAAGAAPSDVVAGRAVQAAAFEEALEHGTSTLPANPDELFPLVREYRFDPPAVATESAPLEVSDYALGYAATLHVRALGQALPRLWLLRMGRREATGEPRGAR